MDNKDVLGWLILGAFLLVFHEVIIDIVIALTFFIVLLYIL